MEDAFLRIEQELQRINGNPKHIIYNNKELQKLLGISSKTLQKWRDNRIIGYSRIGREFYFTHSNVDKMLKEFFIEPLDSKFL